MLLEYIENVLEEEYGYIPGVYSTSEIDLEIFDKGEIKKIIFEEFPKFINEGILLEDNELERILDEVKNF